MARRHDRLNLRDQVLIPVFAKHIFHICKFCLYLDKHSKPVYKSYIPDNESSTSGISWPLKKYALFADFTNKANSVVMCI